MPNYLLLYHGGRIAQTDEDRTAAMAKWGKWMQDVGENLVDRGNPCSDVKSVSQTGPSEFSDHRVSGYSIISAPSMDDATNCAQMVPLVDEGGTVDVYEIHPAM
jgi:hypothetical protein